MSSQAPVSVVIVTGINKSTAKKQVDDFFSFCGSITKLDLIDDGANHQKAVIEFAKPSAASTALMLHGSLLDGANLSVALEGDATAAASATAATAAQHDDAQPVGQEDKPKTAIVAEYLAHGYHISDEITKRAIELDNKHGLSTKFKGYLSQLDRSLGQKLEKAAPAPSSTTTSRTEHTPSGPAALLSATEKVAAAMPVPGEDASIEGPKTTTTVPEPASAASAVADKQDPSFARNLQQRAQAVLDKPEVKSKTDFVWTKLSDYYNAFANHPKIHDFYSKTSKTVTDVHEEAKRIAEKKKHGAPSRAAGTSVPTSAPATGAKQMSVSWLVLGLVLFSTLSLNGVAAHDHDAISNEPAEVAGFQPTDIEHESYIQRHMRTEHHINAFNLGSAFALHDLDRNGVLDRSEIEAIYGVHHSESKKHSPTHEVHDEKADKIVGAVLRAMDRNGDDLITKKEFIDAGPNGLPIFPEYNIGSLGHHYDEESEFFVHHEELYHNSPETQTDESYNHKEDLEHFAKHDKIEEEEERRERKAEGLPTIEEDERLKKAAAARGEKYISPYDRQLAPEEQKKAQQEHDRAQLGNAVREAEASQHVFRTPSGNHIVKEEQMLFQDVEVDNQGRPAHLPADSHAGKSGGSAPAAAQQSGERLPHGVADRVPGETVEGRHQRLAAAKLEASRRPSYGQGAKGFAYPKDDSDRMRKGAPYKYRVKKQSYFGEF
ncbi:related to SSP120-secretory protein [Ustilago bromivora]|uniref:Related to SSP120 - secretory protein n=1 Tax=Ustilago bromivora TaxID=307758 RepID=A0A1K0GDH4_9BASI|nr:related to SSP120-secretory protein [Ustilago bromivora]SYW80752.1 related to SSP120 - secretory protein [Ustilago bromivora]